MIKLILLTQLFLINIVFAKETIDITFKYFD